MASTFDEFHARARQKYPSATLTEIRGAYKKATGNEPIFQQGPTKKEFVSRAMQKPEYAALGKEGVEDAYDSIYGGGGIGAELYRDVKRGVINLGATAVGIGEAAKDQLGKLPPWLGNAGLVGSLMNAPGLPDPEQARKDLQAYAQSIPRSAASQGDVTKDLGQSIGNPLWWAGGIGSTVISQLPVIAAAAASAPVGIPAYLGAGAVGALMEGQSTYATAKDEGLENPLARGAGQGLFAGALNAIPFMGTAGRGLLPLAGRMGAEGLTEGAEEIPGAFLESPVDQWGMGTLQEGLRRGANVAPLAALGGGLNSMARPAQVDNEAQLRELDQLAAGSRDQQFAAPLPDVMSPYVAPPAPPPSVMGEITQQAEPLREASIARQQIAEQGRRQWDALPPADSIMSTITGQTNEPVPAAKVTPPASAPVPTTMVDPAKVEVRNKVLEAKKGAVRTIVDPIISKWKGAPNLTIVGTREELPENVQQMFIAKEQNAVYDGNGNVFMVANDFKNSDDVKKALFHESLGHYGIEQIVPDLARFSADIATMAPLDRALKPVWDEIQATYEDVDPTMRSLEVVARYAESHPDSKHPLVERIYASLRAFARKLGFTMQMNRADLNRMMRQAMRNLEQGGKAPVLSGVPKASRPTQPDLPGIPQAAPTARNPEQLLLPEVPTTDEKVIRVQQQLTRIAPIESPLHNAMMKRYTDKPSEFQAKQRTAAVLSHAETREKAESLAKNLGYAGIEALAKEHPGLVGSPESIVLMASALEQAVIDSELANEVALRSGNQDDLIIYQASLDKIDVLMGGFLDFSTDAGRRLNILQKIAGKVKDVNQLMEAYVGDGKDLLAFAKRHRAAIQADQTPESVEIGTKLAENSQAAELMSRRLQESQVERGQINTQIGALEQTLTDLERQATAPTQAEAAVAGAEQEALDARAEADRITKEIERVQGKPTESRDMDALKKLLADTRAAFNKQDPRKYSNLSERVRGAEAALQSHIDKYGDQRGMLKDAQKRFAAVKREVTKSKDTYSFAQVSESIRGYEAALQGYIDAYGEQSKLLDEARGDRDEVRKEVTALKARLATAINRTNLANQRAAELRVKAADWASRGGDQQLQAAKEQLSAIKKQLRVLRKQDEAMALREAGIEKNKEAVDAQRKSLAERRRKLKNGKAAAKALKERWKPTISDKMLEVFYSNILSGTATQLTNAVGTSTFVVLEESVKQIGLRLGGEGAEANARIRAVWLGATTGLRNAKEAFATEQSQIDQQFKADNSLQPHGAIGTSPDSSAFTKGLGRIIRLPGRMLLATDEFWKGMAYTMEIAEIATRKSGGDLQMARYWMDNPTLEEQREAVEAARRVTFTSKLGESMGGLQRAINKKKALKVVVPFVQTPTNIFYRAMDWSPLGLLGLLGDTQIGRDLKGRGGKTPAESRLKQRMAFTRQTLGGALVMMGWEMAAAGLLAGNGPPEKDAKELYMESLGHALPRSFRLSVDSPWQSFGRYDPLAIPLSIIADMHYAHSVATDLELKDIGLLLMASFVTNMADKTWLHGVSTAIEALQSSNQQAQQLEYFASTIAGGFIPTNLVAQTLGANDKYVRDARTFTERLMLKIPGQREKLARQVDWKGQLRENPAGTAFGIALPSQSRESNTDPESVAVAAELVQLGFDKRSPTRIVEGVELEPNEYEQWKGDVQKTRYELVSRIISSPAYKTWPREYKLEVLEKAWDSVTRDQGLKTKLFWNNRRLISELKKVRAGQ